MNTAPQMVTGRYEYRMKAWYRSILLVFGACAVSGGIVMSALALKTVNMSLPVIMTAVFWGFGIYLIALALRSHVILAGRQIEIQGAFTNRSANLDEIEGLRTISSRNGKYTQIYLSHGRGTLTLHNYFEHDATYDAWIRKIPNLDERDRDNLLEKISQDEGLGATPQDRLAALSQAKTYSIFALVIAVSAAVAANYGVPALFLPFSIALALVPIALAMLLHRSPLLYTVFKRKDDPRAELLYALIVASFGLLIRARGIHFISIQSVGVVIVMIMLAYLAAFYHSYFESTSPTRTFFALLLFGMLYAYGVVTVADAIGDESTPNHYVVRVTGKHYTTGRSRSFYLELEPWGPVQHPNNLGVSKTVYDHAGPGNQICLDLRPGRLNAAWYSQVSCSGVPLDSQP